MSAVRLGPWGTRAGELLVAALILAGCLGLVALPAAWLWLLSQLGFSYAEVFVLSLIGTPLPLIGWGWVLVRLNRFYLRRFEPARAVLEAGAMAAVLIAAALLVWLVFVLGSGGGAQSWPV